MSLHALQLLIGRKAFLDRISPHSFIHSFSLQDKSVRFPAYPMSVSEPHLRFQGQITGTERRETKSIFLI